jgi:hypothetical protein
MQRPLNTLNPISVITALLLAIGPTTTFAAKSNIYDPIQVLLDSAMLTSAAQKEIQASNANGNTETACDLYLINVLNRAGFPIGHFLANEMDQAIHAHLPNWRVQSFATDNPDQDQSRLRDFLNAAPDGTTFLAQWSRIGESGHVALIEKLSLDHYVIYQAQRGLSLPFSKPTKISSLLYAKGKWGDRSHLRLFFE